MRMRMHTAVVLLIVFGMVGCGSSAAPVAPTSGTVSSPTPPSVTSISPIVGSTGGATQVKITGAGLGATVTFGGVAVSGRFDSRYPGALMLLWTPPHAAGSVDVVVSGQTAQSVTLTSAFTYASPDTFDFNGNWAGFGGNGQDNLIRFTIQDNMLLGVSCDSISSAPGTTVTFSPPRSVTNSAFSVDSDGIRFMGHIVSPTSATGIIRVGECASDAWYADKS